MLKVLLSESKIKEIYKTSDIEDYILTVIDYIKIEWDISEVVIYDTGRQPHPPKLPVINWCNMSTEFSIKLWNKSMVLV
jgi:hypothetical protein